RRRVDQGLRPRFVPRRAAACARGRTARRRQRRDDGVGRARAREAARSGRDDPVDAAGLGTVVPLEVLRRQLDARARLRRAPDALHEDVAAAMQPPLAAVEASQTLDEVFATLTGRTNAVVVAREGRPVGVLTRSDLLEYLAHNRS